MGGLWYVIIVFFALFFLRLPIAVVLISSTIVGLWFAPTPIPLSTLPTTLWQGVNHFVLMAIPFFILMGDLALASGVTQRLVNLAKAFVGHIAGGLAHVGVIVNVIMAGMSGSDLADAAATGASSSRRCSAAAIRSATRRAARRSVVSIGWTG